jgi:hypothetical protein
MYHFIAAIKMKYLRLLTLVTTVKMSITLSYYITNITRASMNVISYYKIDDIQYKARNLLVE